MLRRQLVKLGEGRVHEGDVARCRLGTALRRVARVGAAQHDSGDAVVGEAGDLAPPPGTSRGDTTTVTRLAVGRLAGRPPPRRRLAAAVTAALLLLEVKVLQSCECAHAAGSSEASLAAARGREDEAVPPSAQPGKRPPGVRNSWSPSTAAGCRGSTDPPPSLSALARP